MLTLLADGPKISFGIDTSEKSSFDVERFNDGHFVISYEDESNSSLIVQATQLFDGTGSPSGNVISHAVPDDVGILGFSSNLITRSDGSFLDIRVAYSESGSSIWQAINHDNSGNEIGAGDYGFVFRYGSDQELKELENGSYVYYFDTSYYTDELSEEEASQLTDPDRNYDTEIRAYIYRNDGSTMIKVDLEADFNTYQDNLRIAPLESGKLLAVWEDSDTLFGPGTIRGQIFDGDGQRVGSDFVMVDDPTGSLFAQNIVSLDDGNVAFFWTDEQAPSHLFFRFFDQSDNAVGPISEVAILHGADFGNLQAVAVDGGFAIAWMEPTSGGRTMWAQLFDAEGSTSGDPLLVAEHINNFDLDGTSDGFSVNWTSAGPDTALFAQSFTIADDNVIHGNGVINGTELADQIIGGAGPDTISGLGGDDTWLFGDGGSDQIHGGAGNDIIGGGGGSDGNLSGDAGSDTIYGGDGNDSIFGGAGDDGWLSGDAGSDQINGEAGNDTLSGGDGDDSFLSGDAGNDEIYGGAGNDTISGGDDDDHWLSGGAGDDEIYGGDGNDVLDGGDGDDHFLAGQAGADEVYGGAGNDTLSGDDGADFLAGGVGDDRISGGNDADMIAGDSGNDSLAGEAGNDTISGGGGSDFLVGGEGADRFAFATGDLATTADAAAFILDFSASEGDVIDLLGVEAKTGDKFAPFIFIGAAAFSHQAGELQITDQGGFHLVSGDTDGDGQGDFFLKVSSATAPTRADFDANEYIPGTAGDDPWLFGGRGSDQVYGLGGNDVIGGGDGDDRFLSGGNGADQVYGGDGNDIISGDDGNDPWLSGQAGNDTISGGDGNDMLSGDDGDDVLAGSAGNDEIYGGEGDDYLLGEGGTNTLLGGAGNDTLRSEQGDNLMYGGTGADVFSFQDLTTADVPTYTIGDFARAEGDKIQLFGIDAIKGLPHDAFTFIGSDVFTGQAGQLRYSAESGHFVLSGDITGDGAGDFFINLYSTTAPEIGDFLL